MFRIALLSAVFASVATAQSAGPPLAKCCPTDAVAYFEIDTLEPVVKRWPWAKWKGILEAHPKYREFQDSPQKLQLENGIKFVEQTLGTDLADAGKRLSASKLALAVLPGGSRKEPRLLLWVRFSDAELWKKIRTTAETFLAFAGDKLKRSKVGGKDAVCVDGKLHYLIDGETLLLSNHGEAFAAGAKGLAGGPGVAGLPAADGTSIGRFWANVAMLREAFPENYKEKADNVLGLLLFGDLQRYARTADTVSGRIEATAQGAALALDLPGQPAALGELAKPFCLEPGDAGAPAAPKVPGYLGGFVVKRDLAALYKIKEQLMADQVLPEFDKFENGINNLIPGKSFGADLMPLLGKHVTVVAARQDYGDLKGAKPAVKIPAFGLIVEMTKPKEGSDIMKMFMQAVPTIINFEAKKNGSMPQLLDVDVHNGVKMSFTYYPEMPKGDKLPPIFNLQASSATVGNHWIFASSKQLCKDLIDAYQKPMAPEAGRNVLFDLSAAGLKLVAEDNADLYVASEVAKGTPTAEVQANWAAILKALDTLSSVKAHTEIKPNAAEVRVEVNFQ